MGAVFDVYRVASHRFHVARWLLPALDIVYWAAATFAVFAILLSSNQGEVRMYVFLGLGIGVTGYFGLLSTWVVKLSAWSIDRFKSLFHFLWKAVHTLLIIPLLWIVRVLAKLLDVLFVVTAALVLWIGKVLLLPISLLGRWIWPKLLPVRRRFRPLVDLFKRLRERWKLLREWFRKKS